MSKYTTGEIAKLCDITVRTVQYYDRRNILNPSETTDGGRRLYHDDDLKKLKVICFLRGLGISIDNIGKILAEENSDKVISLLLEQQIQSLKLEINDREAKLHAAEQLKKELNSLDSFSVESIQDIAYKMENSKKLRKVHMNLLAWGLVIDLIEVATLVYGFVKGNWIPFIIALPIMILMAVFLSKYYFDSTAYICPSCHTVFKPKLWSAFWAAHTPKTRRLTCPNCREKSYCAETYDNDYDMR